MQPTTRTSDDESVAVVVGTATSWGFAEARRAALAAGPLLDLDCAALVDVRALSTVVLRAGDRAVKVYPPGTDVSRLQAVLGGVPADTSILLLPELGRPPLVETAHGVVSSYRWLEPAPGLPRSEVTWPEIGAALRTLHAAAGVAADVLPRWTPLTRVPDQLAAYASVPGHDPAVPRVLSAARELLLAQVAALRSDLGWGLVHGDVSQENILRNEAGSPVFVDLDWVAYGPREYDLLSAALRAERGEIDERTYLDFCAAYGHDVRAWSGLPLVRDVCDLGGLAFGLWAGARSGLLREDLLPLVDRWA